MPLLLAIGWNASKLALEWHPRGSLRADVAAFSSQDRSPDSLRLIIEAKSPGTGLVHAKGQLFDYAQDWETPLVTTDEFSWVHYRSVSDLEPAEIFCQTSENRPRASSAISPS